MLQLPRHAVISPLACCYFADAAVAAAMLLYFRYYAAIRAMLLFFTRHDMLLPPWRVIAMLMMFSLRLFDAAACLLPLDIFLLQRTFSLQNITPLLFTPLATFTPYATFFSRHAY